MRRNSFQIFLGTLELQSMVRGGQLGQEGLVSWASKWQLGVVWTLSWVTNLGPRERRFGNMRSCQPALDHIKYEIGKGVEQAN